MLGFLGAFGVVFLLMGLAFRFLGRFSRGMGGGRGQFEMEVLQRLALGQKQGIAVVKIGEQLMAVSMGEGGVRHVADLDAADLVVAETADEAPAQLAPAGSFRALLEGAVESPRGRQLKAVLRSALRTAAMMALLIGIASALGVDAAHAQAAAQTAGAQAGNAASTADAMLSELSPTIDLQVAAGEGLHLTGTVGIVVMMGLLTLLPTLILMMTSFTRIFVVLHFLRQAIGTQSAPPGHLMAGLALLLTGFVMAPTLSKVNSTALEPWMAGQMEQGEMLANAVVPFKEFMLQETRQADLRTFVDMSGRTDITSANEIPLVVMMSAFVTSELRTAFQIGFAVFLPFIVIDVVVASVLMSMGMFMLPPPMIALPFKILLFVLVDGWTLVIQGLVSSFGA